MRQTRQTTDRFDDIVPGNATDYVGINAITPFQHLPQELFLRREVMYYASLRQPDSCRNLCQAGGMIALGSQGLYCDVEDFLPAPEPACLLSKRVSVGRGSHVRLSCGRRVRAAK